MEQKDQRTRDGGSAILGWLVRVSVVLAVLGVIAMDGISIASTRLQIEDAADSAARAASWTARTSPNRAVVINSAAQSLSQKHGDYALDPNSVRVGRDRSVTLTVSRTAQTVLLHRIKPLAKYGEFSFTSTQKSDN